MATPGAEAVEYSLQSELRLDAEYNQFYNAADEDEEHYWYDPVLIKDVSEGVKSRLIAVSLICLVFITVEAFGAYFSRSIAVFTDVAHLFSDVLGFVFSLVSIYFARMSSTRTHSYGYVRAEMLGALFSLILVWVLSFWIFYEAVLRLASKDYQKLDPFLMVVTSAFAICVNIVMAFYLHGAHGHGHGHNHTHSSSHTHEKDHKHSHRHDHPASHSHGSAHKHKHGHENGKGCGRNHEIKSEVAREELRSSAPAEMTHQQEIQSHAAALSRQLTHPSGPTTEPPRRHRNLSPTSEEEEANENSTGKHQHGHSGRLHCSADRRGEHRIPMSSSQPPKRSHQHQTAQSPLAEEEKQTLLVQNSPSEKKERNLSLVKAEDSHNLRAAWIHILGDLLQSVGVFVVAVIIYFRRDWAFLDPVLSISFSVIALSFSFPVGKDIIANMLDSTPPGLDLEHFIDELRQIKFIVDFHDLHIWQLSFGKPALTVHIVCLDHPAFVLKKVTILARKNGIYHSTVQVEKADRLFKIDCGHNVHS